MMSIKFIYVCVNGQGSLYQWTRFVITADVTSPSGFFDASLGTSGVWLPCGVDPYMEVDKHEWVISNELEPFSGESGDANLTQWNNTNRFIHRASTNYQTILHQCLLCL